MPVEMKTNTNMRNTQQKPQRYGIFYRSNGRWTSTPYAGVTFTQYTMSRRPINEDIRTLRNNVLKSRVKILPVVVA